MEKAIKTTFCMQDINADQYSPLTLAYMGDCAYEIVIRTLLVHKGNTHVDRLNKRASNLAKAATQSQIIGVIQDSLTQEELTIYKRGRSYANKYLVMYVLENKEEENRLGISVSKKVGNSVIRHRITRLIRESYRLQLNNFKKGYDIVVIARASAKEKNYSDIESALLHLGKLHNIIDEKSEI